MCTPTQCRYLSASSDLVLAVTPSGRIRAVDPRRPRALGHDAAAACKRPRVFIDVSADGGEVAVEFTDNGPGLEREDLACVFAVAAVRQAHGPEHGRGAATGPPAGRAGPPDGRAGPPDGRAGLGLAACSELVRFMGGRIRMDSRPPRGTTVVLVLPAAPPPE